MNGNRDGIVYIIPDGWEIGGKLQASDWSRAQAYLESGRLRDVVHAVNIKVTGRGPQRRGGSLWIRVQIEFVKDDEPSVMHGGWLLYEDLDRLKEFQAAHVNRLSSEQLDLFGCFTGVRAATCHELNPPEVC